jgi:hypothetical protein
MAKFGGRKSWVGALLLAALVGVMTCGVGAETEETQETQEAPVEQGSFKAKEGTYLSFSYVRNSIGGDFDDTVMYQTSSEAFNVPDADSGGGFGIGLGVTADFGGFEINYQRSSHETHTVFVDIGDQDAAFNVVDFNFRINILRKQLKDRIKPYVLLGFGIPWITIENSMTDGYSYDDETFVGISGNIGGGVIYYITPRIFANAGAFYRWSRFGSVEGVSLDDKLSGSGPSFSLGLSYTF